jgi:uncharacterized protein YndB with AHSA1/START domain
MQTTQNFRDIKATQEEVYNAFIDPKALETWQVPGNMDAIIHHFDLRVGGGYEMSLLYPESEKEMKGKTTDREDKYRARFVELIPNEKIVQSIEFETPDPQFAGEMIMEITFAVVKGGTRVTFLFKNIPKGIKPQDNEAGAISALEKPAKYVETKGHRQRKSRLVKGSSHNFCNFRANGKIQLRSILKSTILYAGRYQNKCKN